MYYFFDVHIQLVDVSSDGYLLMFHAYLPSAAPALAPRHSHGVQLGAAGRQLGPGHLHWPGLAPCGRPAHEIGGGRLTKGLDVLMITFIFPTDKVHGTNR